MSHSATEIPRTGGAGTGETPLNIAVAAEPPIPPTFAGKLEVAKAARGDHAKRFAALRAGPPVKKRSTFVEGITKAGGIELKVVEEVKETPFAEVLAGWKGPIELTPIPDIFKDKLDYAVDSWAKLEALSDGMAPVMEQFELLQQDVPKVVAATTGFVTNYRVIGEALAAMEARAAGDASVVAAVEAECKDLTARMAAIAAAHGVVLRMPSTLAAGFGETAVSSVTAGVPIKLATLGLTASHLAFLRDSLRASGIDAPRLEVLYQATVDGVTGDDVLRKCKDKGAALIVGREATAGWLFGGYVDTGISNSTVDVVSAHTFVFTLTNPHGQPPTAWRRMESKFGVYGGGRNGYVVRWDSTIGCKEESVLQWDASDSDLTMQSRAPHDDKAFTGAKEWTCSDVLIYRV